VVVFPETTALMLRATLSARWAWERSLWHSVVSAGDGHYTGTLLADGESCWGLRELWLDRAPAAKFAKKNKRRLTMMSKLVAAQQCFEALLDKTAAYGFAHKIGLTTFGGTRIFCEQPWSSALDCFRAKLGKVGCAGDTPLYDCLATVADELSASKMPGKRRLILLTDGQDTNSGKHSSNSAVKLLRAYGVVMDVIAIGDAEGEELKRMSYATGGVCFRPSTAQELIDVGELETLVRLSERAYTVPARPSLHADGLWYAHPNVAGQRPKRRDDEQFAKLTLSSALNDKHARSPNVRLLAEFQGVLAARHPNYQAWVCEDDLRKWRVIMCGPAPPSPYAKGVFILNVLFPVGYPAEAPELRFATPVLHVNVNQYGKVCHDILRRSWDSAYTMVHVLNSIYGLLLVPEVNAPINSVLALRYHQDQAAYESDIAGHCKQHCKSFKKTLAEMNGSK